MLLTLLGVLRLRGHGSSWPVLAARVRRRGLPATRGGPPAGSGSPRAEQPADQDGNGGPARVRGRLPAAPGGVPGRPGGGRGGRRTPARRAVRSARRPVTGGCRRCCWPTSDRSSAVRAAGGDIAACRAGASVGVRRRVRGRHHRRSRHRQDEAAAGTVAGRHLDRARPSGRPGWPGRRQHDGHASTPRATRCRC